MTTISTQISFPVGVRALIGEAARRRREMERRSVEVLDARGYDEVILPLVDFVDPYSNVISERAQRQSYRFTDREGELIAVRADFTPMVARVIAPLLTDASQPIRMFYRGDVIRYEASKLGRNREFFQIGAEIVGDPNVAADVEMIALAVEISSKCGAKPIVAYRDAAVLPALVDGSGIGAAERQRIASAISSKRPGDLLDLRGRFAPEAFTLLSRIVDGSLSIDDLAAWQPTAAIAQRLRAVTTAAAKLGITLIPVLDELPDAGSYYTGIQFDLYSDLARAPLARGGRYDTLYGNFGTNAPAVGFTMSLDLLEESFDRGAGASGPRGEKS